MCGKGKPDDDELERKIRRHIDPKDVPPWKGWTALPFRLLARLIPRSA